MSHHYELRSLREWIADPEAAVASDLRTRAVGTKMRPVIKMGQFGVGMETMVQDHTSCFNS